MQSIPSCGSFNRPFAIFLFTTLANWGAIQKTTDFQSPVRDFPLYNLKDAQGDPVGNIFQSPVRDFPLYNSTSQVGAMPNKR